MRTFVLILGSLAFLSDCTPQTRTLVPVVPTELREPCPVSDRRAETVRDLAVLAAEHLDTAQCANGRIAAIDTILRDAAAREERVGPQ